MPEEISRYRQFAALRVEQLQHEDDCLRSQLFWVRMGSWPLQIISIVLPVAAGSVALLKDNDSYVSALSFVGAAAVALHRGLNCEAYQSGLKRMTQAVRSIVEDYECIGALADEKVAEALRKAEARLHELRATSIDVPPKRRQNILRLAEMEPPAAA
jgi:hypothetical protein